MRPILAFAILLLGASSPAVEPEYSVLFDRFHAAADHTDSLLEIETSTGRGDRLAVTAEEPRPLPIELFRRDKFDARLTLASASPDIDLDDAELNAVTSAETDSDTPRNTAVSIDDLCTALFASAQNNDLPIPFFANLLWQESRLRADDVSKKGAQGIAQFMPKVASEKGLENPFDPMQAIPASARFLRELRLQFGNLGFVAAAYNAGARRVAEWLERRGSLPRETRTYVVRVTGLSIDSWRKIPVDNDSLTFVRHLPCRGLPAFANVEQTQSQEAQLIEAKLEQSEPDDADADDGPAASHRAAAKPTQAHEHPALRSKHEQHQEQREAHRKGHEHHAVKREAEHTPHAKEKRKTA